MIDQLDRGVYVLAVSGGVDSMVLLHMIANSEALSNRKFIVAHYDHGIRPDSKIDRELVQQVAKKYGLQFVYEEGNLGSDTSEEAARKARYEFLRAVLKSSGGRAIVTAHHQDDLLETAIFNMLRGTGRAGMVSLKSRANLIRPLLNKSKQELIAYAKDHGLVWREDVTNSDLRYKRNVIRHKLMAKMTASQREQLLGYIKQLNHLHNKLELELTNHLHLHPGYSELDRHWFIMLPHATSKELMLVWLRRHKVLNLSSKKLEKIVTFAKTAKNGSQLQASKQLSIRVTNESLIIES